MFSAALVAFISLLVTSQPAAASPSPQTSTPAVPATVCFPAGDPLAGIMSITSVGEIIGSTGTTTCPSGHTCTALTTAQIEAVNSALAFDPEFEFIIALLRSEEPGVALLGTCS